MTILTLALSLSATVAAVQVAPADTVTILLRNGTVYDGVGSPGRVTDVGISDDRVVFIGDAAAAGLFGRREIDATGLIVSPGFVDPHAHAAGDLASEERDARENLNYLMQGVTTVVVGNDGGGPVDVAATRSEFEAQGIGTNAAVLVGFGSVRREVLGDSDASPTVAQVDRMKELVARAMEDGAVGLSAGLYYSPQSYSETNEVLALARVAARYGGVYDTHLRDESSYTVGLVGAVEEAITIGREAGLPVNISHIKALGTDVWGLADTVIALIRAARADGLQITADQYPYEASGTSIRGALIPRWALAGGADSLASRAADPARRARIVADMTDNIRRRNGADALLISAGRDERIIGMTLAEIAAERGLTAVDAALEIELAGGARVASFNMNEDDIRAFMQAEFVMTGSDGSDGHPRKFGTYPRKIRDYVLDDPVLSMSRMIEASTSQPADAFGLTNRGRLTEGSFADIAVFDPATIREVATFENPRELSTGMRWVIVNGEFAVDEGLATHVLLGRVLTGGPGRPIS